MPNEPVSSYDLVKQLRALAILDEVRSNNSLGKDAADAIEALEARIAGLGANHQAKLAEAARVQGTVSSGSFVSKADYLMWREGFDAAVAIFKGDGK